MAEWAGLLLAEALRKMGTERNREKRVVRLSVMSQRSFRPQDE